MKLYYMPGTCALADHIVLEWIGAAYEAIEVARDQLRSDWFLALNPGGVVPVLQAGNFVLTENVAILNYLAELNLGLKLAGDGSAEGRAEVNRWLAFINCEVHKAFAPIFSPARFLADESQHEALRTQATQNLHGLFARLDRQLQQQPWIAGEAVSIADPYLFVVTRWARAKHIDLNGMDALDRFFERMRQDPGVMAAMQAEGL